MRVNVCAHAGGLARIIQRAPLAGDVRDHAEQEQPLHLGLRRADPRAREEASWGDVMVGDVGIPQEDDGALDD